MSEVIHYIETDDGVEIFVEFAEDRKEYRTSAYHGEDMLDLEYDATYEGAQASAVRQVSKFGGGVVPW